MKIFISYKFTGELKEDLIKLLTPVMEKFTDEGIEVYCNFFDEDLEIRSKNYKLQDYLFDAFKKIDTSDVVFVILHAEEKSEGMLMEIGYAFAKNIPIVVAIQDGIANTYLPRMAKITINWSNVDDLLEKISKIDLKNL